MPADTGSDLNQSSGGRGDPRTHLTRQWLEKAAHDLTAARLSQDASLADVVTFHCQQAAEKALKAYLTWRDEPFGKTHELAELVAQCAAHDSTFERLRPAAKVLAPYAIEPRYPGEPHSTPSARQAAEAQQFAQEIVSFVLDRLPPEVRP